MGQNDSGTTTMQGHYHYHYSLPPPLPSTTNTSAAIKQRYNQNHYQTLSGPDPTQPTSALLSGATARSLLPPASCAACQCLSLASLCRCRLLFIFSEQLDFPDDILCLSAAANVPI